MRRNQKLQNRLHLYYGLEFAFAVAEVVMSEVKVSKKKAAVSQKAPLSELLAPIAPFVTVPLGVMRDVAEGVEHAFGIDPGSQAGSWTPAIDLDQFQDHLL